MKGHPIPCQTIIEVIDKAKRENRSLRDVSRELGISVSAVSRFRYLNGDIIRKSRTLTESQHVKIRDRFAKGESGPSIASSLGIAHATVYEIIGNATRNNWGNAATKLRASIKWEGKRVGKDNPNYRHGKLPGKSKSSYFLDEWAKQVKIRDGHRCLKCGSEKLLEAHHVIPVTDPRTDSYPLMIVDVNNGITLCAKCHWPTAHREREFERECRQLLDKTGLNGETPRKMDNPVLNLPGTEANA